MWNWISEVFKMTQRHTLLSKEWGRVRCIFQAVTFLNLYKIIYVEIKSLPTGYDSYKEFHILHADIIFILQGWKFKMLPYKNLENFYLNRIFMFVDYNYFIFQFYKIKFISCRAWNSLLESYTVGKLFISIKIPWPATLSQVLNTILSTLRHYQ
jgi:hypothetical protein